MHHRRRPRPGTAFTLIEVLVVVSIIALLVAVLLFGFIIGGAGLLPTVLLTTFIAALAGQGTTPARAAVIAVGITILCMVIFVFLLRLTVPLFGPWVGG